MDGQATAPEMLDVDGLADLLTDDPETGSEIDEDELNDSDSDEGEESDDQSEESEEDSDSEEETDEPATDRTVKVKLVGDDGQPVEKEVTEKELIDGYMMRSDYTRKTQDLAQREKEITQVVATKFEEHRNHYLHEAQVARAVVEQFAGFRSQQEMAQLAQEDPAAWVAENQRQQTIAGIVGSLEQRIQAEQAQSVQQVQARARQMYESAWSELKKDGIDKVRLSEIYEGACKTYGFSMADFSNVYDPRAVRVLKDNAEMRARLAQLTEKAATVQKQVLSAPKIPNKSAPAHNERKAKALESKFRSGTARLNDLAAWLS